jgi:hypothetical protein
MIVSERIHDSSNYPYSNPMDQHLNQHNERTLINVDDMIQPILTTHGFTPSINQTPEIPRYMAIDDMLQPILPRQDCSLPYQQSPSSSNANMIDVNDMIQPILATHGFTPSINQTPEIPRYMAIDDMLQPILPRHDCSLPYQQPPSLGDVNMVDVNDMVLSAENFALISNQVQEYMVVDDMLQPILPSHAYEPHGSRPALPQPVSLPNLQSDPMETVPLMNQPTAPRQVVGQMEKQAVSIHGSWPAMSESLETQNQNPFYGRQAVPAV